jgi:hypothetical protein
VKLVPEGDALDVVRVLTRRVLEYWRALGVPGDRGERTFRGWLVCELLVGRYRWPCDRILAGEVFDLLLLDRHRLAPRIYVETKTPVERRLKPAAERETAERCSTYGLGTLERAYLTNGWLWREYEVHRVGAGSELRLVADLDIETASPAEFDALTRRLRDG